MRSLTHKKLMYAIFFNADGKMAQIRLKCYCRFINIKTILLSELYENGVIGVKLLDDIFVGQRTRSDILRGPSTRAQSFRAATYPTLTIYCIIKFPKLKEALSGR